MAHRTLIFVVWFLVVAAPARAQAPRTAPYVNGPVSALLVDGDTLYVGGTFCAAGTAAGPLVLAAPDGRVVRTHPGFSGLEVRAVAADGAGGWYAGGTFERVDGWERGGLVHLLADGTVDPEFHGDRRHRRGAGAPRRVHAVGRRGAPDRRSTPRPARGSGREGRAGPRTRRRR